MCALSLNEEKILILLRPHCVFIDRNIFYNNNLSLMILQKLHNSDVNYLNMLYFI